jgi:hypothetical protein
VADFVVEKFLTPVDKEGHGDGAGEGH